MPFSLPAPAFDGDKLLLLLCPKHELKIGYWLHLRRAEPDWNIIGHDHPEHVRERTHPLPPPDLVLAIQVEDESGFDESILRYFVDIRQFRPDLPLVVILLDNGPEADRLNHLLEELPDVHFLRRGPVRKNPAILYTLLRQLADSTQPSL